MRIVQALGSSRRGGAEQFFIRLVEAFHRRGVPQAAIVRGKSWVAERLGDAGVPVQTAPFGGSMDIFTRRAFRRTLQTPPADIALTWMRRATAACPKGPWLSIGRLGNYYKVKGFAGCDHLVGITPGIVEHIAASGWPAGRATFIPNFVPAFAADPVPRALFDTPENVPLILWLGRMEHDKGPDVVIRALTKVPGAYLWMAGAGSFANGVKALANELGVSQRVRFLGWRDDIHRLLAAADIYVCASRFEAHGNIILEAWAHGLPIVSARSPGPAHLIDDGKTGLLTENADPDAMAAGINALIANEAFAKAMGETGYKHFSSTYSEEGVVTAYLDLFRRLITARQGPSA